ncbi:uncharacterized protein [Littorina saxatilis]|uniref:uncharacterized protein isoform X2 n=1 Tax=Littorina saxatilis TaxID=31220 RepID=UPI0038B676AB
MMRGAPDSVTVVLLCVLVLTVQAGAVKIQKCSHGSVTLDENNTPAYLTCDGLTLNDTITWTVNNKNTLLPITCLPQNTACVSADTHLFVNRTGSESRLRVSGNYRLREGENGIMCSAANQTALCTVNVIDTFVFPVSIVAGVAGGSVVVIILVVVVVVQVRRRRPVTKPPESDEAALEDDASTYDDDLERPGMPKDIEEDGCGYATVTEATSHGASSSDYGYAVPDMSVYTQPSGTSDRGRKASTVTEATSHRASSSDYGYAVPDMSVYTQPSGTSDRDRKASTVTVEKGGNLYAEPDVPLFTQLSRASDRNRKASTVTVEKGGNLYAEPDVPLSTQPSGAPVKDSRTPTVTLREDGSLYSVTDIVSRVTVSIPSSALETPDDPATHTYAQVDRNAKRSKSTALVFNADQSASSTDVYAQVNKATKRNTTAATEVNKGVGAHEQQPEEIVKPKPTLKPRISVKPKLNK